MPWSGSRWLASLSLPEVGDEPLLIVCRNGATVRAVYRHLAELAAAGGARGYAGLQVSTLGGLIGAATPHPLVADEPDPAATLLPAKHPWMPLLDERPGLRAMLRDRVARLHEAALAGAPLKKLRREVATLLEVGWGAPESLDGARRLLATAPSARCVAVGFASEPFSHLGEVGPLERRLLAHLGATYLDGGDLSTAAPGALASRTVPDTAAEARVVAVEAAAAAAPGRVLVLVPDVATGDRVRAALRRNGVPAADDGARPLSRHALVAILEPLLPVVASRGKEPLAAAALVRLLTDPVLSRTPPDGATITVPGVDEPRATVKHVREMVVSCGRARATVAQWLAALSSSEKRQAKELKDADDEHRPAAARHLASARVVRAQVERLARHAGGDGRLADLHELVSALGLSDPAGDRLGHAIVRRLDSEGYQPADPQAFAEAVGDGVASGRVDDGVQVLSYASYDGRDCDLLILTGVHDKGLAHAPAPDPLLTEEELALAGIPSPAGMVRERLCSARWAATRAGRTLALVSQTDASGRRVSAPVELELAPEAAGSAPPASYGLDLRLPELADCAALGTTKGAADPLATQVDVEWIRRGAAFDEKSAAVAPAGEVDSLKEQLGRDLPRVPANLRPWLGDVGAHPKGDSGLPPGFVVSASRLQAFTQCLYRAYCQSVLRLKAPEEVAEDLDAREVGSAVHAALQQALKGVFLLLPEKELAAARKAARKALAAATAASLEAEAQRRPDGTDTRPLALARKLLAERWLHHWEAYLEGRIADVAVVEAKLRKAALKGLDATGEFLALQGFLGPDLKPGPQDQLRRGMLEALGESLGDAAAFRAAADTLIARLAAKNQATVSANHAARKAAPLIDALCVLAGPVLAAAHLDPTGDWEIVAVEQRFGDLGQQGDVPMALPLGREAVPVRGSIDAVVRRHGRRAMSGTRYGIVDYKTGAQHGTRAGLLVSLTSPQLAFYALVLEAAGGVHRSHPAPAHVEHVELDFVKKTALRVRIDDDARARAREVLGFALDEARDGRFPTMPYVGCCPLLAERGAFCDFADVCRLRREYEPERGDEEAGGGEGAAEPTMEVDA